MLKIGLTGLPGSGRRAVINCFNIAQIPNHVYSLPSIVQSLAPEYMQKNRDGLIRFENILRREDGCGVLARKAIAQTDVNDVSAIFYDGIRHPGEVATFRKDPLFILFGIHAPEAVRYARKAERANDGVGGDITYDEFLALDRIERGRDLGRYDERAQIEKCLELADYKFINNDDDKRNQLLLKAVISWYECMLPFRSEIRPKGKCISVG